MLNYLKAKSDPPQRLSGSMVGCEGVAATALTLRWGSYLAVLLEADKPIWQEVNSPSTSRISDPSPSETRSLIGNFSVDHLE